MKYFLLVCAEVKTIITEGLMLQSHPKQPLNGINLPKKHFLSLFLIESYSNCWVHLNSCDLQLGLQINNNMLIFMKIFVVFMETVRTLVNQMDIPFV